MVVPDHVLPIRVRWYCCEDQNTPRFEIGDYCSSNWDETRSGKPALGEQGYLRDPYRDWRPCTPPPWTFRMQGAGGAVGGGAAFTSTIVIIGRGGAVGGGRATVAAAAQIGAAGGGVGNGRAVMFSPGVIYARGGAVGNGRAVLVNAVQLVVAGGAVGNGAASLVNGQLLATAGGAVGGGAAALHVGADLVGLGGGLGDGKATSTAGVIFKATGGAVGNGKAAALGGGRLVATGGAVGNGKATVRAGVGLKASGGAVGNGTAQLAGDDMPIPTGTIFALGGGQVPTGYLLCDGAGVSRTLYAALFNTIGTAWGAGDGSTTFNVPDLRGRSIIGVGSGVGLTPRQPGDKGGEETHKLTVSEMPSHNHGPPAGHTALTCADGPGVIAAGANQPYAGVGVTGTTGGDGVHNNMHPYGACIHIIKT